jgi:NTE family protein
MASTCIPGLFIPVEVGGRMFVDGGLVDNLPVSALEEMGATVKIGVNVNRWISKERPKNMLDVVVKSFEIATTYRRPLADDEIFIEPHLEAFSPSDFSKADQLVDEGYRAAMLAMPDIERRAGEKSPDMNLWETLKSWLTPE